MAIPGLGAQGQDNPMDYDDVMPDGDGFSEGSDQPRWKRNKVQGSKLSIAGMISIKFNGNHQGFEGICRFLWEIQGC